MAETSWNTKRKMASVKDLINISAYSQPSEVKNTYAGITQPKCRKVSHFKCGGQDFKHTRLKDIGGKCHLLCDLQKPAVWGRGRGQQKHQAALQQFVCHWLRNVVWKGFNAQLSHLDA